MSIIVPTPASRRAATTDVGTASPPSTSTFRLRERLSAGFVGQQDADLRGGHLQVSDTGGDHELAKGGVAWPRHGLVSRAELLQIGELLEDRFLFDPEVDETGKLVHVSIGDLPRGSRGTSRRRR